MGSLFAELLRGLFESITKGIAEVLNEAAALVLMDPLTPGAATSFSWFQEVLAYVQVVAFGVALAIRLFMAAKEGILTSFKGDPFSAASYLFDTVWVLALIAAAPAICVWLSTFAFEIGRDIFHIQSAGFAFDEFAQTLNDLVDEEGAFAGAGYTVFDTLLFLVLSLVMVYYCISVLIQCFKRQVLISFLSIALPITLASESTGDGQFVKTYQDIEIIVLAGFTTALQLLMLQSVMGMVMSATLTMSIYVWITLAIALFGAIKQVPEWVSEFSKNLVPAGHSGGRIAMGVNMALRSLHLPRVRAVKA